MAYSLSPWLKPRFFITGTNRPLAGGLMYTYKAGTTENATTYSDDAGTPNTNPIVLDSDGQCDLFLDDAVSYRIILKNSAGVTQFDKDRIASLGSTQVQSFNSIAALRLRSGTTIANAAKTLGYYSAGDGGGNSFYWDSTSTATDNGGTVIKPTAVSGAGRWLAVDASFVSVSQFGAVGGGIVDDTSAFTAAVSYMNSVYVGLDGFLRDPPKKGILHVPPTPNGEYVIKEPLVSTGNYGIIIDGVVRYAGVAGTVGAPITVWTIGRLVDFDFIADLDYKLGMYTTLPVATSYINAFKLQNMADCRIFTTKMRGFNTALTCLASGASNGGWYGNTAFIGTMDSNIIDIDLRSENFGSPNANRFFGGFFYKTNNATFAQNCFKFSSDGNYVGTDSNLIDGCNFEGGKGTGSGIIDGIPINLEVGIFNKFTNIRAENASYTALALIKDRDNTIQTRAVFSTSTEIISQNVQQTVVIPQSEMIKVFSSGDLARESVKLSTSGRIYNRNVTFNDYNILNQNSTLSTSAASLFDLTTGGIKFSAPRAMMSFKVKTNGDRRFLLRTFAEDRTKKLNIVFALYDSSGVRLANDAAIATGTWGVQQYIKSNLNVPLGYYVDVPWTSTGGYITPITVFQTRQYFEVHPNVATIEVYYRYAASGVDDDITISHFELYSIEGNASPVDACAPTSTTGDRLLYTTNRGSVNLNLAFTVAYDPPSLASGASVTTSLSASGAAVGDIVTVAFSADTLGADLTARVSAASAISVTFTNNTGGTVDISSGVLSVACRRIVF